MSLRARTRPLDKVPDPVAVAGDAGILWRSPTVSLAGRGEALRLSVDRTDPAGCARAVSEALASIATEGDEQPVALGAWPFDPNRPGELVVPEVLVTVRDSRASITTVCEESAPDETHRELAESITTHDAARTLAGFSTAEPLGPGELVVTPSIPAEQWCEAVSTVRDELRSGTAEKVVMAREVVVTAAAELPRSAILARLADAFGEALIFSVDGFTGASPELLVARNDQTVRCHPMAGTAPRRGNPEADAELARALSRSTKNLTEHRHTIDLVHDLLLDYCSFLDEEAEPSLVAMSNVSHLGTRVEGQLSRPPASVVELMCVLHPTPAVCGRPTDAAMALIAAHEQLDRGRYAGPVGWVDAAGNGEWAVGIRSAQIEHNQARLYAGVGVVSDSEPLAELAETRAKLAAMLGVLARP